MPGATVRAEQRIERRKLEPARIILARQIARGHKSGDVRPPEWREAERVVQSDWHVRRERGPARLRVPRPNPAAVPGNARVTVPMQTPRAFVGTFEQRS